MLPIWDQLAAARSRRVLLCLLAAVWLGAAAPLPAVAQNADRWVTDDFEVTMRTGKSNRQSIVRMLSSGTRVELLELDEAAGYALVRTAGGAEGWVLTRYLVSQPPAKIRLPGVQQQLQRSQSSREELQGQLRDVTAERDQLRSRVKELEGSTAELGEELTDIRRLSANVIEVDDQNQQLRERLAAAEKTLTELERENDHLANRAAREWFVVGAGVVVFGMVLGLILPRIRWRRKSSWSDF